MTGINTANLNDRGSLPNMVGKSPAFLELARLIRKIAGSDAPILIEGETGTGKELTARVKPAMAETTTATSWPASTSRLT